MSKIEKLGRMNVTSFAAVTTALMLGCLATIQTARAEEPRVSRDNPVTLTPDGRMKLTVVASRHEPVTLLADGRMKVTVTAPRVEAERSRRIESATARAPSGHAIPTLAPIFLRP